LRRIGKVIHFASKTSRREYATQDYINGAGNWVELPQDTPTPFDRAEFEQRGVLEWETV